MTLGCLLPYRRLGIGTVMFLHVLNYAENDGNFDSIFLHVQINNGVALEFYKKFDFEIIGTQKNYYKCIESPDAFVLEKAVAYEKSSTHAQSCGRLEKKDKKR
uniref:N-terminal methionine N(alpha)-acetyltransferase NatE n=1 Tax=Glossina brevipalpis TaxID=37001 RepID=A0A1A9X4Z6_9MUSC